MTVPAALAVTVDHYKVSQSQVVASHSATLHQNIELEANCIGVDVDDRSSQPCRLARHKLSVRKRQNSQSSPFPEDQAPNGIAVEPLAKLQHPPL